MNTKLQPHQQRVIDRLFAENSPHGIIAYHSMGSGKTFTALKAAEKALDSGIGRRALFVVPASLVDNVHKEITKHKLDHLKPHIDVISYDKASRHAKELAHNTYALSVFDEAHRLRNPETQRVKNLQHILNSSHKTLLLTGTAGYNHPSDIASLINRINPRERLPETHTEFESQYINGANWRIRNAHRLQPILRKYIDKYDTPNRSADFPSVSRNIIHVKMSEPQAELYKTVERSIPKEIRAKIRHNLPISLQDSNALNLFSQGVRQAANTPSHHDITTTYKDSPKIMMAAGRMLDRAKTEPGFRGVMYSNYMDAGVIPYSKALENGGIKPLLFTGNMSAREKKRVIQEYNKGSKDAKVLLLSSSGGEGLDLKNTRLLQILEPHFNKAKLQQAEARAIRYKSHESLPKSMRHVDIEEYRSELPKSKWQSFFHKAPDTGIDEYLSHLSDRKQGIIKDMTDLV